MPGICFGSASEVKATYLAFEVGSNFFSTSPSGTPSHGITIDQPSTQRMRYTRSSGTSPLSRSSSAIVPGFAHSPPTATAHGLVRSVFAASEGSFLRVPRSEEHTSELQSLMRISYAVFCLKKKKRTAQQHNQTQDTRP